MIFWGGGWYLTVHYDIQFSNNQKGNMAHGLVNIHVYGIVNIFLQGNKSKLEMLESCQEDVCYNVSTIYLCSLNIICHTVSIFYKVMNFQIWQSNFSGS